MARLKNLALKQLHTLLRIPCAAAMAICTGLLGPVNGACPVEASLQHGIQLYRCTDCIRFGCSRDAVLGFKEDFEEWRSPLPEDELALVSEQAAGELKKGVPEIRHLRQRFA